LFCYVTVIRPTRLPGKAAGCHRWIEAAKSETLTTNYEYGPVAGELLASMSFV